MLIDFLIKDFQFFQIHRGNQSKFPRWCDFANRAILFNKTQICVSTGAFFFLKFLDKPVVAPNGFIPNSCRFLPLPVL